MEYTTFINQVAHTNPVIACITIWGINLLGIMLHIFTTNLPEALLWGMHISGVILAAWASIEVIITNRKNRKKDGRN